MALPYMEIESKCEKCGSTFFYSPSVHRCPGEWEAMVGPLAHVEPTTWVEECMEKQARGIERPVPRRVPTPALEV